jgi:hypothetical protein
MANVRFHGGPLLVEVPVHELTLQGYHGRARARCLSDLAPAGAPLPPNLEVRVPSDIVRLGERLFGGQSALRRVLHRTKLSLFTSYRFGSVRLFAPQNDSVTWCDSLGYHFEGIANSTLDAHTGTRPLGVDLGGTRP